MQDSKLYVGVVEARSDGDPYRLGRCKVRIFGVHSDDIEVLKTDELPWAMPILPSSSAGIDGIGSTPTGLVEGSWVVVQFLDQYHQIPIIMGTLPGKPVDDLHGIEADYDGTDSPENANMPGTVSGTSTNAAVTDSEGNPIASGAGGVVTSSATGKVYQPAVLQLDTPVLLNFMKPIEGCRLKAYWDANGWAIGYGNHYMDVASTIPVREGQTITQAEADALFLATIVGDYGNKVRDAIKVPVTISMYAALTSLAWNGGQSVTRSLIFQLLNSGDYAGAAAAIIDWKPRSGKISLLGRRQKERALFESEGFPSPTGGVVSAPSKSGIQPKVYSDGSVDYTSSGPQTGAFKDPNGTYPKMRGESSTNRLARPSSNRDPNKTTIVDVKEAARVTNVPIAGGGEWNQIPPPFNAKWPYNHVYASESGHIMEYDDTPGAERVAQWHKAGTYYEIDANGTQINRIVGDKYEIIDRNGFILIRGDCNITVMGDCNLFSENDVNVEARGDVAVAAADNLTMAAGGNITLVAGGTLHLEGKGDAILEGSHTHINDGIKQSLKIPDKRTSGYTKMEPLTTSTRDAEIQAIDDDVGGPPAIIKEKYPTAFTGDPDQTYTRDDPNGPFKQRPTEKVESTPLPSSGNKGKMTKVSSAEIPDSNIGPNMPVSKHFKLKDFLVGGRTVASIQPNVGLSKSQIIQNLQSLCVNCLDPIYEKIGPFSVNSWIRSKSDVDRLIAQGYKASRTSQHLYGEAVDLRFNDVNSQESGRRKVKQLLALGIPFHQIILENSPNSWWIHIGLKSLPSRGENAHQVKEMKGK